MNSFLKKTWLTLIVFLLVWCSISGQSTSSTIEEVTEINIWVIAPFTGPLAHYGRTAINVYSYVVNNYNNAQEDVHINLYFEDGKCNKKFAASAAQKLISVHKVQAILWGVCSAETLWAWEVAQREKIVLLSPLSASSEISDTGDYVFRYINNTTAAKHLWEYLHQQKKNNTLVIMQDTTISLSLYQWFKETYTWTIQDEILLTDTSEENIINALANINKQTYWAIVILAENTKNAWSITKTLGNMWVLDTYKDNIYGAFFFSASWFTEQVGEKANWLQEINIAHSTIAWWYKAQAFLDDFWLQYPKEMQESFIIFYKTSIDLLLESVSEWAISSQDIKKYIYSFNETNPIQSLLWEYYFKNTWDAQNIPYSIQQIIDNQAIEIKEIR